MTLPVAGAALVAVARTLPPGDGGHSPLAGIGGGATPLPHVPGVALAALGTLAFGAVLGPEARIREHHGRRKERRRIRDSNPCRRRERAVS